MKKLFAYIIISAITVSLIPVRAGGGLYGHRLGDGYSIAMLYVGPAYLFGDIGGKMNSGLFKGTSYNPSSTRPSIGLGYRYIFPNNLSIRGGLSYTNFYGTDSLTNLSNRQYQIHSSVIEFSLLSEFFIIGGPRMEDVTNHSLYVFTGAGNVTYIPNLTGNARTQDVIKNDIGNTPVIPFGLGYEYYLGNNISIGSEFVVKYIVSDFLDGLKTPYSKNDDMIVNFNVTLTYNFSLGGY